MSGGWPMTPGSSTWPRGTSPGRCAWPTSAGNRLLGGRILAAMSHQAIYLGNRRQAIDFAQAARNLTRQVATPRVIAMEAAMEACAHAAAGDAGQCHRALGDAAEAVALLTIDQDDPDWLDFDEGGYWGHAARAYRDLGELRKAEECAARSVGLCLPEHSRTRAQRTTIQATAHLAWERSTPPRRLGNGSSTRPGTCTRATCSARSQSWSRP